MFTHRILRSTACVLGLFLSLTTLQGAVIWNESVDGDLSTDPGAPTALSLFSGENTIIGSISGPIVAKVSGYDEATFTVPANSRVFSITLGAYGPDATNMSLFNLYQGPLGSDQGTLLASATLEVDHVGLNLLQGPAATMPLASPLQPGAYTIDLREGGAAQDYEISIHVNVIPEPSAALLAGLALGCLALGRRRGQ